LVNRFIERYRTDGRPKVRSRAVSSLMVESLVLKKKRECEMEKGEEDTRGVIDKRTSAMLAPYKICMVSFLLAPYSPP
jgi:hypothetical protein